MYPQAITTREPTHKQNYVHMFDYVGIWLAGWRNYVCLYNLGACPALGWLARPRDAERGGAWKEQACHALGWRPQKAYVTHTHAHTPGRSSACRNASRRLGALRKCLGMLQGGLGRLGEASGRLVGSAWEMIGEGLGRLGEACSVHARPLWGSLGGLGRLGAAWGMLGNASGRLGECLGMLREVRGDLERLGEGLGNAL